MSGNDSTADNTTIASGKPDISLNEREKELYIIGMAYCKTAGPAKIDWAEFQKLGDFNTQKTAQNTWSKIKGKLPEVKAAEGDGKTQTPAKNTTPKKRTKKSEEEVNEESEAEETPAKKVRKTPAKKGKAKVEAAPEEEGEAEEE